MRASYGGRTQKAILPVCVAPLPAFATLVLLAGSAAVAADYPLLAANAPPSPADNEAAARHAKLTACLKEAKEKKLVGPQKAAFIKQCVAAR